MTHSPAHNAQCEKVGHLRRFWVHVQFKLAFDNHIYKMAIFLVVHKQICKLKARFPKMLLKSIFFYMYFTVKDVPTSNSHIQVMARSSQEKFYP